MRIEPHRNIHGEQRPGSSRPDRSHPRTRPNPIVAAIEATLDLDATLGFANLARDARGLPLLAAFPFGTATRFCSRSCLLAQALDADVVVVVGGTSWMELDRLSMAFDVAAATGSRLLHPCTAQVVLPEHVAAAGLLFDLGLLTPQLRAVAGDQPQLFADPEPAA